MFGRRMRPLAGALVLLAAAATACGDSGSGPEGAATVSVLLTDAPGDIQAWVAISEVYLQGGEGGRTVLATFDPVRKVELTALANSTTELVNEVEVPAGTYSELRIVISGGCLAVEGSSGSQYYATDPKLCEGGPAQTGTLQMPSFGSAGLKVKFDEPLEFADGDTPLLLDFDVSESFGHEAGNSGRWVMNPVIRGATLSDAGTVAVTLQKAPTGTCSPALGEFKAELRAGTATTGEQRVFTDPDANQIFEAKYQYTLPGPYTVALVVPAGASGFTVAPTLPAAVTVTAGQTVPLVITLTCLQ